MAYGLDIENVYYADHNLIDIGVLNTYEISLDIADEKDFQITTNENIMDSGYFWYIPDTEYGGIIDSFEADSDDRKINYKGKSWRGLLANHIVDVPASDYCIYSQGDLDDAVNELITSCGLSSWFVCDALDTNPDTDAEVSSYQIPHGTTLYDAITGVAASVNFNLVYKFNASDRTVHLIPILKVDYTDYMKASDVAETGFRLEVNNDVVNHVVIVSEDADGSRRKIHLFADEAGGIQPYSTVRNPIKDAQYILDERNQVLTGIDEVTEYILTGGGVVENYEPTPSRPYDWTIRFGNYYRREIETDAETGETTVNWVPYEAVDASYYARLTEKPANWDTSYTNYYTQSNDGGNISYNPVSAQTELDTARKKVLTKRPIDWAYNYGNYYDRTWNGNEWVYSNVQGASKDRYIKMTSKPSDWATNYNDYYRYAFIDVVWDTQRRKAEMTLVDALVGSDLANQKNAKYVKLNRNSAPKFKNHPYYRKETDTVAPKFEANKYYNIPSKNIAPTWQTNMYFVYIDVYNPPNYVQGSVFRMVLDHYASMIEEGLSLFDGQKRVNKQTMFLDDFEVNIGDMIGGRDEFTGITMAGIAVSNINVTIDNGIISLEYVVGDL